MFLIPLISNSAQSKDVFSAEIVENTWNGFKHYFINSNGRVVRPKEADTVSEGQAYAMLRAVWLNDKATFDNCYRWTEKNLSRLATKQDNLLCWHWKSGSVTDQMPASDADVDYALSLIFAHCRWGQNNPKDMESYDAKAKKILSDILKKETFRTKSNRLYLAPWVITKENSIKNFPLNPSYFSPAQFRIFYEFTKDKRWMELIDTTYMVLDDLSTEFNDRKGIGLFPDWCSVDGNDTFTTLEGKSSDFGHEAIRILYRISLDLIWYNEKRAENLLKGKALPFIESQIQKYRAVYCEYSYTGSPLKRYENAGFYSCYATAIMALPSKYIDSLERKNRNAIKKINDCWVYNDKKDYYTNCLGWWYDGLKSEIMINFLMEK